MAMHCGGAQAWGVLEAKAGKYQLARQLFRCAVKVNPQSEPSWSAWAQMEGRLGFLQRANDLRKYSLEERTEVVPPRSFADPDKVRLSPAPSHPHIMPAHLAQGRSHVHWPAL